LVGQGKIDQARVFTEELLALRRKAAESTEADAYKLNCYAYDLIMMEPADLRDAPLGLAVALQAFQLSPPEYHYNRYTLGLAYRANGQIDAAIEMLERALAQVTVEMSEDRMKYERALVSIFEQTGNNAAAEDVYRETLRLRREVFPADHADIAQSLLRLGETLLRHGRPADAEPLLTEALAIRKKRLPNTIG